MCGNGKNLEFYELNDDYNLELKKTCFIDDDHFEHRIYNNFIVSTGDFKSFVYNCLTNEMHEFNYYTNITHVSNDIIVTWTHGKSKFLDFNEAKVKNLKDCTCYYEAGGFFWYVTDNIVQKKGIFYSINKSGLKEIEPYVSLIVPFSDKYLSTLKHYFASTSLTKEIINHVVMKYLI